MANRNYANGGRIYSPHVKPVQIDMQFTVASTDAGGLGITGLKGPMVQNVFMNTNQTPGAGNKNPATPNVTVTNPNPAAGTIVIQLQDNFNQLLNMRASMIAPASGSDVKVDNSAMTIGVAYTITTLGNSTAAQWHSIGVPAGITPAVGVTFIASAVGIAGEANTSTSRVQTSAAAGSGVFSLEMLGNPQLLMAPSPTANQGYGAQIILQSRKDSAADAPVIAAIADGTIVNISLWINDSSVTVQGE